MTEPIRYYFDEHIPGAVSLGLRRRGVDVLTAQDAGRCGLPDPDQLQFALKEVRVLVTFDADYLTIAAGGASHAGIAFCHSTKYSAGQLLTVLLLVHSAFTRPEMHDHVEYL